MGKAVSSVLSEFFVNNLFELDSNACKCEKDTVNVIPGEPPETTLKIYSLSERPVHFLYSDKDGLNMTGAHGRVVLKNILGQVLATNENDVDSIVRLIEKAGFILPISFQNYEAIEVKKLMKIINRIKATVNLMNAIDGKSPYEHIRMFNAMTHLLYDKPVELNLEGGPYTSCLHDYYLLLQNPLPPRDFRNDNECILENGNFEISDSLSSSGKAEISHDLFNQMQRGDVGTIPGQGSSQYRNLFFAYISTMKEQSDWAPIVDFYMNFQNQAGIIDSADINGVTYYDPKTQFVLNDDLVQALPKVARMVLSKEINHNICNIHMQYDGEGLAPKWIVGNLLQALYFAIFYMKPGIKIYKRCANPNCKRDIYFLTDRTKTNKQYCCTQCRSATGRRRRRLEEQVQKRPQS